jgi:hypothetical protein
VQHYRIRLLPRVLGAEAALSRFTHALQPDRHGDPALCPDRGSLLRVSLS